MTPFWTPQQLVGDAWKALRLKAQLRGKRSKKGIMSIIMGAFKRGELYTSTGVKVTRRSQAVAIGLEAQRRG